MLIAIIISLFIGSLIGFIACALLTANKTTDID